VATPTVVSFDLFGTLVRVDRSGAPAAAVAAELRERGVAVPAEFEAAYRRSHVDAPEGAEVPLPSHVGAALGSLGVETPGNAVHRAVVAAFDHDVTRRSGARAAVEAAREHGPVAVCSNCSVPGLAHRALVRADLYGSFEAVVTSVGCGWRKPDPRAFSAVLDRFDDGDGSSRGLDELVHVGDDPRTDGGLAACDGHVVLVGEDGSTALEDDATLPDGADTALVTRVDALSAVPEALSTLEVVG
jgi:FMN phosphatase YigB (HAD superfamily)